MAQQVWSYTNAVGFTYSVGIYHGNESGHVLIYADKAIIVIDFSVKSDKIYSFYLDDDFFELGINFIKDEVLFTFQNMTNNITINNFEQNDFPIRHLVKMVFFILGLIVITFFAFQIVRK